MLRPSLRTARPDHRTGLLADVVLGGLLVLFVVTALLSRLPAGWVALAGGLEEPVRAAALALALYLWAWLRALVIAALPRAPFFFARRLVLRSRGRRRVLRRRDVAELMVEGRPPDDAEVLVIVLRDGSRHEVCPLRWRGAGRLYRALARWLR